MVAVVFGVGRSQSPEFDPVCAGAHARLSAGPFNWDADLPFAIGGQNLAPSPTAYLLGACRVCGGVRPRHARPSQFGVQIEDVSAVARCSTDARGLLGIEGVSPELGDIALDIDVTSPDPESKTGPMLAAWRARCPIFLALLQPNAISLTASVAQAAA